MLDRLDDVPWPSLAQPPWNPPDAVPAAIRAVAAASPETVNEAYDRLMHAMGNNAAGTYFPVAVTVIPFLGELLSSENPLARLVSLDAIADLIGSFVPEDGMNARVRLGDGPPVLLRRALREQVVALRARIEGFSRSEAAEGMAARDILDSLQSDF